VLQEHDSPQFPDTRNAFSAPALTRASEGEGAWIGFLRLITNDMDPTPTLARVQAMRCAFSRQGSSDIRKTHADP